MPPVPVADGDQRRVLLLRALSEQVEVLCQPSVGRGVVFGAEALAEQAAGLAVVSLRPMRDRLLQGVAAVEAGAALVGRGESQGSGFRVGHAVLLEPVDALAQVRSRRLDVRHEGRVIEFDRLGDQHVQHALHELLAVEGLEAVELAARAQGGGDLLRRVGRQVEAAVAGVVLHGLAQVALHGGRELVRLVQQHVAQVGVVHRVAGAERVERVLEQVALARRAAGVDFEDVRARDADLAQQ